MIKKNNKHLLNGDSLVIGIGELAEITGVTTRQLRYWESKGFIESLQNETFTTRNFNLVNILKVELIKEYLDEGYTLKKAAEKVKIQLVLISNVKKTLSDSFKSFEILKDRYTVITLGNFSTQNETIYLIRENDTGKTSYHVHPNNKTFNLNDIWNNKA